MERYILNVLGGARADTSIKSNSNDELQKLRRDNREKRYREVRIKTRERLRAQRVVQKEKRYGDQPILDQIFPPEQPEPEPVLTKNLIRDYILFDRVDDLGNKYRYGVFAVFSSFVKLDSEGNYLDPSVASNVDNETRVLTVKSLITPRTFGSNSKGEPFYVEHDPIIEFLTTNEDPTDFIDQIYLYQFGGNRFLELKKNTRKKVERDELEDVVDPMDTPFAIESAISQNQQFYNRHILDLYYKIVNHNYISSTPYEVLMQTVIVMLGI
jgi:hypothetical protein